MHTNGWHQGFVALLYYVLNSDLSICKWVDFVTQNTRHQS